MVRIPPSIPHGTQTLLPSKFCLLAPQKRARIVSHSGERCVRIAEVEGSIPFESTIERISEPYIVWGKIFVQTKRHPLP